MRLLNGYLSAVWIVPLIAFLAGCGKSEAPKSASSSAADYPLPDPPLVSNCEPGVRGGRLVIASFAGAKTFNPLTENEQSSSEIVRLLFSGLVDVDVVTQEARPALAESWSVESDQKTWTFKLRKNLFWSDGHPLTAEDVLFTWQIIYDPKIRPVIVDLFRIDDKNFEVTLIDERTLKVVTPAIYAPFLVYFGSTPILPKHILEASVNSGEFRSAYGVDTPPEKLVGSGPFRLKSFKPDLATLMERNPYYYAVDKAGVRLPYLDSVVYSIVPDMNAMSLKFLSGECDAHEYVRPDEYARFKEEATKSKERFQLYDLGTGLERSFLFFNQNTNVNPETKKPYVDPKKLKWFRNAKFRQAIAHAIDRDSVSRTILGGRAVPSYSFGSQANLKWFNPSIREYPFDLSKSRALFKEIGIDDRDGDGKLEDAEGNRVSFTLHSIIGNPLREKIVVLLKSDFTKLGLEVTVQTMDFNTLGGKLNNSFDYEAMLAGLGGGDTDPTSSMNVLKSDGFTHWWFPRQTTPSTEWEARIDFLMNAQLKTLVFAERKKYVDEVQEIMNRELPFIYTVAPLNAAAIRADVGNVRPTVLSTHRVTWNAEELYFKKKP